MKVRARKASSRMSDKDPSECPNKKRRKEAGFWQRRKEVAAALITSSSRKRRIENTAVCLVSPSRVRVVPAEAENSVADEDLCRNLHLTFSSMDSSLTDLKEQKCSEFENVADRECESEHADEKEIPRDSSEVCLEDFKSHLEHTGSATRPSLLETIFSPVFHLFKGHGEDSHTNCQNSVEQTDAQEQQRVESADATSSKWKNGYQEAIAATCQALIPISSKATTSLCRIEQSNALPPIEDHSLSMKPYANNGVVTLVDGSGECIEWTIDDKVVDGGEALRPILDHTQGDADVLGSDAADLFLAVEQSKSLECNDEGNGEGDVPPEEEDDFEDIDPYLFIKRLPSLSEVVSPCRPLLLPRQTRRSPPITLVLDLDETLVHSTLEHCADADFSFPVHFDFQEHMVYVRRRPHLQMFMERVAQLFEIIVFTASQSVYAEQLLNVLDPKRKLIRHRIFRDSCVFVRGNYLKDLTILGRDLSKVAIIDNSPQAYGFQVDNGIPIESWFDDRSDSALAGLLPFLETLVGVDDVRPIIAKRFNLRQKIAAAAELPYIANKGDPLDRFS
ncbi:CTD small phosphatase-like protein 2 [Marchantia polymorpha subsp. ruderalis]|uniref:FCP1 homology domain-containing protein n=2 Tax=Marchantia polymorpha TaxID=3197 RepID=A0A176VH31_MARPO|nr:hypothetical protein AXG93_2062s1070 [Marchantia polymorpha subsp. ruderalis]PTQ39220.1 hypothetical protein MARPO_0046s0042 [Marchantia polymorpha]BBN15786.1 hypothetical protein Mp_7g00820 [Marchantia polymorpha subsp. ruderalis]|eukprot:PTQ39220.1 hypothetical protein MARPO_0046s0042 [Marchantia polymorpha]